MTTIAGTADVADTAAIGDGTRVWHLAQIREDATVGSNCNIGRGAYIGPAVVVGDNCNCRTTPWSMSRPAWRRRVRRPRGGASPMTCTPAVTPEGNAQGFG